MGVGGMMGLEEIKVAYVKALNRKLASEAAA
jgi:hypothetical protein